MQLVDNTSGQDRCFWGYCGVKRYFGKGADKEICGLMLKSYSPPRGRVKGSQATRAYPLLELVRLLSSQVTHPAGAPLEPARASEHKGIKERPRSGE